MLIMGATTTSGITSRTVLVNTLKLQASVLDTGEGSLANTGAG